MTTLIGAFARAHGLSRSTLLYYERMGLLRPSGRTASGHRFYGPDAGKRMARISLLRDAGLPLRKIRALIDAGEPTEALGAAVEEQLAKLNRDLADIVARRRVLLGLLSRDAGILARGPLTKELWIAILSEAGLDADARARWHRAFERDAPEDHEAFLISLGLTPNEIATIRAGAQA